MKCEVWNIVKESGLARIRDIYEKYADTETIPYAKGTSLEEICNRVIPDREGMWVNPLFWVKSVHKSNLGRMELCRAIKRYIETEISAAYPIDVLSIISGLENGMISVYFLIRVYNLSGNTMPYFDGLYEYIGEEGDKYKKKDFRSVIRESIPVELDSAEKKEKIRKQQEYYRNATSEMPFLNSISEYTLTEGTRNTENPPIYDLMSREREVQTIATYERFTEIFQQIMRYINGSERDSYFSVIRGQSSESEFLTMIEAYIMRIYVTPGHLRMEDLYILLEKLRKTMFKLYIIQDLIDDPDITDIKITAPDSIRVRIDGKAYLSNISFIDDEDYFRFIRALAIKNRIDLKVPTQTFTEERDENYILRFSITAQYITPAYPIIHVRKVPRKKLMAPDLIRMGFFDEKIRDYLLDCGKRSRGVVFAGPPGSGKTVALNWFLEDAYEDSAEILVIQENDELFCNRKGVMFEHVVNNPAEGEQKCTLEQLGQMALVAGANVFVIGEAKGAEICSAITLSNSGCRTAITIHSPSSTETIDKMADLALRGYAQSYEQAVRMLKSFQTIVYLQDFKVQEITEIEGYDEEKKTMKYRYIYRRTQ